MNREDIFYKELSVTPELPTDLYNGISKKIIHRKVQKSAALVVAVISVLAFGIIKSDKSTNVSQQTIEPEIALELQIIQDYLNGNDVSEESELYAYMEIE